MGTAPIPAPDSMDELHGVFPDPPPTIHRYTLGQRWRSRYHAIWYRLSERMRWSRRPYRETPVGHLSGLTPWQASRIEALRAQYGATFEYSYGRHTALANYAYLDLLDQAWHSTDRAIPEGGRLTDVGCASFWYAHTLHRFFHPGTLRGVDVEGFRLYPTGYSRYDAAAGYVADLPHTSFTVADYSAVEEQVELITAWFPFVTPAPVLAWRLPLTLFAPEVLFRRIAHNLVHGGMFFMVNQGEEEADIAAVYCRQAGLHSLGQWVHPRPLRPRPHPPVASWWTA